MNRRLLITGFATTAVSSLLLKFSFVKHKIKTATTDSDNTPFKVVKRFKSNLHPNTTFSSAKEFWASHPDPIYKELNERFKDKGLLVSSTSRMLDDQKTIIVEKVYKNEQAYNFYKEVSLKYHNKTQTQFADDLVVV